MSLGDADFVALADRMTEGPAMKAFFAEEQKRHDPKAFLSSGAPQPNPEQPERVERLLAGARPPAARSSGPSNLGLGPIAAVHTPEYIDFLQHIYRALAAHRGRVGGSHPQHPPHRARRLLSGLGGRPGRLPHGRHRLPDLGRDFRQRLLERLERGRAAAEAVMSGEPAAYALCRPPGHHAFADVAGGFCFINNSAVAAQHLRKQAARVAILDVDLHHGNGTQGIFYARADVLTVSIHADPVRFYPFFWGHADERGEGPGLGYNLNLPLPRKSGDDGFLDALEVAKRRIVAFAPDALGRRARPRRIRGRSVRRAFGLDAGLLAASARQSPRSACRR